MTETCCYMVTFGAFTDFDRFIAVYQANVGPVIDKFGGRYVLVGEALEVLEGDFPGGGGSVISVWPNRKAALAFWNSREYAELKQLQVGAGTFQVVLVDAPMLDGGV